MYMPHDLLFYSLRRSQSTDAAAIIAANTRYNSQLGQLPSPPKLTESPTFSSPFLTSDEALPAEGISRGDSARERTPSITSRQASRSASFSLPDVKSGKMVRRPSTSAGSVHGEEMVEEEEDDEEANMDPDSKSGVSFFGGYHIPYTLQDG